MIISVFNADDHPALRRGVTALLNEVNDFQWVGSAADGQEALEKIQHLAPDVALLDMEMPHLTGLEVATQLIAAGSSTKFVILTLHKNRTLLHEALHKGIKGYLLKESKEHEIIACIRSVVTGKPYVNASLTHFLMPTSDDASSPLRDLSEHERNILKLVAREKTSREIADMLFISPKTVANHRNTISKKLGLAGVQNGLLKWAISNRALLA